MEVSPYSIDPINKDKLEPKARKKLGESRFFVHTCIELSLHILKSSSNLSYAFLLFKGLKGRFTVFCLLSRIVVMGRNISYQIVHKKGLNTFL